MGLVTSIYAILGVSFFKESGKEGEGRCLSQVATHSFDFTILQY